MTLPQMHGMRAVRSFVVVVQPNPENDATDISSGGGSALPSCGLRIPSVVLANGRVAARDRGPQAATAALEDGDVSRDSGHPWPVRWFWLLAGAVCETATSSEPTRPAVPDRPAQATEGWAH